VTSTLADLAWPRSTARLTLRPLEAGDAEAAWRFRRLPETVRWVGSALHDEAGFLAGYGHPDRLGRMLAVEHEGRLVGELSVGVQDAWAQRDVADRAAGVEAWLGWVLDPAYGGRGLATEAVEALLEVCLDDRAGLGLRRVTASCFVANEPSWRLMERVGMRREQLGVADSLHRDHGWLDGCTYALLSSEWHARRVGVNVR